MCVYVCMCVCANHNLNTWTDTRSFVQQTANMRLWLLASILKVATNIFLLAYFLFCTCLSYYFVVLSFLSIPGYTLSAIIRTMYSI